MRQLLGPVQLVLGLYVPELQFWGVMEPRGQ